MSLEVTEGKKWHSFKIFFQRLLFFVNYHIYSMHISLRKNYKFAIFSFLILTTMLTVLYMLIIFSKHPMGCEAQLA